MDAETKQREEGVWTRLKTRRSSQAGWTAAVLQVRWSIEQWQGGSGTVPQILFGLWFAVYFILRQLEGREIGFMK